MPLSVRPYTKPVYRILTGSMPYRIASGSPYNQIYVVSCMSHPCRHRQPTRCTGFCQTSFHTTFVDPSTCCGLELRDPLQPYWWHDRCESRTTVSHTLLLLSMCERVAFVPFIYMCLLLSISAQTSTTSIDDHA